MPAELGWDIASSWNIRIVQSYIHEHYGVSMSREGARKLLHRMRLSWTRPTYTLAKGDPDKQKAFEQEMEWLKKLIDEHTILFYADETHVRSYQVLRATWAEVGQQKQVPTYGPCKSFSIWRCEYPKGDTVLHRVMAANATTFLDFLTILENRYPDKLIVLVLYNARIHHAKMAKEFLRQEGNRFRFVFLPYIPHSSI